MNALKDLCTLKLLIINKLEQMKTEIKIISLINFIHVGVEKSAVVISTRPPALNLDIISNTLNIGVKIIPRIIRFSLIIFGRINKILLRNTSNYYINL